MKIGILTFHRAINYGAVLQCYALKETLSSLGHDVYVIDYRQPYVEENDRHRFTTNERISLLLGFHLRSFLNYNKEKKKRCARQSRFDHFLNAYFKTTEPCDLASIPKDFDAIVVGSDQVWNSKICNRIDPVYWGAFERRPETKLISYAASTTLADLTGHWGNGIPERMMSFDKVSVREKDIADFINSKQILSEPALQVLDPSLLADAAIWDKLDCSAKNGTEDDYVLYFGARACKHRPNVLREKAERFAKIIGGARVCTIDFDNDSPELFIQKFRRAKAVFTSSFHGVAFSLVFNRRLFAVKYGDEQDLRYVNLLRLVGGESCLIDSTEDKETYKEVEFSEINENLRKLRTTSINFLKEI